MRRTCVAVLVVLAFARTAGAGQLPDSAKTPGEANSTLTQDVICAPGFRTGAYRNVSAALKRQVYAAYGMANHKGACAPAGCEIDHLISLELGGANTGRNLWPQPFAGLQWNAKVKDKLENWLHEAVCRGDMALGAAQACIASDWVSCYQLHIGAAP